MLVMALNARLTVFAAWAQWNDRECEGLRQTPLKSSN